MRKIHMTRKNRHFIANKLHYAIIITSVAMILLRIDVIVLFFSALLGGYLYYHSSKVSDELCRKGMFK